MSKDKLPFTSGFVGTMLSMAATGIIMDHLMGGIKKMFGEEVPKRVVAEIMQGVMDGIFMHFEGQFDDLKRDKENLQKKVTELEEKVEKLEMDISNRDNVIEDLNKRIPKTRGRPKRK